MTTEPDTGAVRTELIERVGRSWDELHAAVDRLDDQQLSAAGPDGGWSVKDHLVHLERWEAYMATVLEGGDGRAELGIAEDADVPDENAINDALQRRYADVPVAEVRRRLRDTHARMIGLLGTLDEAEVERQLPRIGGNTHGHFDEHRGWISTPSS